MGCTQSEPDSPAAAAARKNMNNGGASITTAGVSKAEVKHDNVAKDDHGNHATGSLEDDKHKMVCELFFLLLYDKQELT
jgi:hypothetical protein